MSSSTTISSDEIILFPTEQDEKILQICVRVAAGISLMFASHLIYSVVSQKYYRQRIFHRIMVGCAINIILLNIMVLWGQAAVPAGTPGFPYAKGNQATCTTQGFFFHMALVAPLYYSALSILCYIAFTNKYQLVSTSKIIEICIHIGVYILNLIGSFYLLSLEAYNPSFSRCSYGSYPVGCGDQSPYGIECERGPQNFGQIARLLGGLQIGIFFLLPTIIMFITFIRIRLLQGPIGKQISTSFAIQSCFYLSALYITYIPKFIFWGVTFKTDTYIFSIHLWANIFEALQGLWFYLPYYYFRSDPIQKLSNAASHAAASSSLSQVAAVDSNSSSAEASDEKKSEEKSDYGSTEELDVEERKGDKKPTISISLKTSDDDVENNSSSSSNNNNNGKASNNTNKTSTTTTDSSSNNNNNNNGNGNGNNNHAPMIHRPTFSIFDGSSGAIDPNSPWSKYLYDDFEDDSYREDCGEYDDSAFVNVG